MTGVLRWLARMVFGDYRLNWVLRSACPPVLAPVLPAGTVVRRITAEDRVLIGRDDNPRFRDSPGDVGTASFVLVADRAPRCVAQFVAPADYRDATIWPLAPDSLALVNIVTRADSRGRGFAPLLIAAATTLAGGGPAICFIWWNHHASLRAFRRAGWRRIGFSVELTSHKGRIWRRHIRLGR